MGEAPLMEITKGYVELSLSEALAAGNEQQAKLLRSWLEAQEDCVTLHSGMKRRDVEISALREKLEAAEAQLAAEVEAREQAVRDGMSALDALAAAEARGRRELHVIFDGPPSHESGRFIEAEDEEGRSVRAGEWRERPDGWWALVIPKGLPAPPVGGGEEPEPPAEPAPSAEELGQFVDSLRAWLQQDEGPGLIGRSTIRKWMDRHDPRKGGRDDG